MQSDGAEGRRDGAEGGCISGGREQRGEGGGGGREQREGTQGAEGGRINKLINSNRGGRAEAKGGCRGRMR